MWLLMTKPPSSFISVGPTRPSQGREQPWQLTLLRAQVQCGNVLPVAQHARVHVQSHASSRTVCLCGWAGKEKGARAKQLSCAHDLLDEGSGESAHAICMRDDDLHQRPTSGSAAVRCAPMPDPRRHFSDLTSQITLDRLMTHTYTADSRHTPHRTP